MQLVENSDSLPDHLQIKAPSFKIDFKNAVAILPPEQRKQLEELARLQGTDLGAVFGAAGNAPSEDGRDATKEQAPGFMSKTHVYMKLDNQLGSTCGKQCESIVEQSVAIALSVWKNGCWLCSDDFAAFLMATNGMYVDSRILKWLESPRVERYPLANRDVAGITIAKEHVQSGRLTMKDPRKGPELLDKGRDGLASLILMDSRLTQKLCSIDLKSTKSARSLVSLYDAACTRGTSKRSQDSVSMTFSLLKGETSCRVPAGMPKAIGCGRPDLNIELAFEGKTTFGFEDFTKGSRILVGERRTEDEDGTLVVIHEVGHWFGLQHVVPASGNWPDLVDLPDIMQNSIQSDFCLTPLSINLMNAMADATTQKAQRLGGGALLPRKPRRN